MKKHEKAFGEIKNYYNDITHNNLDLIRSLKDEVSDMKKKEISNEKLMFEIAQENKKLSEPLTRALKEVEKLRHELANYQKDKMSLQNAKSRLHVLETQLRDLTWEHEVLEQRFHHVEKARAAHPRAAQPNRAAAHRRCVVCVVRSATTCMRSSSRPSTTCSRSRASRTSCSSASCRPSTRASRRRSRSSRRCAASNQNLTVT